MHAIEKILARAAHTDAVKTGEIITVDVDFAEINDLYLQTLRSFYEIKGEKVWDRRKVAFVFDHYAPCPTINAAINHKEMRAFAKEQKLTHHFDIDAGVCHQVMAEAGISLPGKVIFATDSHTTLHGAFGCFGTGVGATDMAVILKTGRTWVRVPEIINIHLKGMPAPGTAAKDVILYVIGMMKADGAVYKSIEFTGEYIEKLDIAGRMVICNMSVEMGAKSAYIQPNEEVLSYVSQRAETEYEIVDTDPGYEFTERYEFDITGLGPQVACPDSVDNVMPLAKLSGIHVDQCFIGSCTGGRIEDIREAWEILRGKHIAKWTRLIIIPASSEVMLEAMRLGYVRDLMEAGAAFSTPGCGPCLGAHEGVIAPGEVAVTATNRNFPGRMGSSKAQIYLASPGTVAYAALNGVLGIDGGFYG